MKLEDFGPRADAETMAHDGAALMRAVAGMATAMQIHPEDFAEIMGGIHAAAVASLDDLKSEG